MCAGDEETAWAQFDRFPDQLSVRTASVEQLAADFCRQQADYWQAADHADIAAGFDCQSHLAVLAARRDDAPRFNLACRNHLQRHGRIPADAQWFAGQVIMIERNDYPLGLFNGDIGLILRDTDGGDGALAAYFPDGGTYRKIPPAACLPTKPPSP